MKKYLKNIIESQESRAGYIFDIFIQVLIVLSLVSFSFETVQGLSESTIRFLKTFELISIIIFTSADSSLLELIQ